jgi:hypothetical protein
MFFSFSMFPYYLQEVFSFSLFLFVLVSFFNVLLSLHASLLQEVLTYAHCKLQEFFMINIFKLQEPWF